MTKRYDKALDHQARRFWVILQTAVNKFVQMDGSQSAAAFAHFAFFSLFPLIMLFVTITSVFINRERAGVAVIAYVKAYVPIGGDMQNYIFDTIIGVVNARGQASAVALLMLVWSAMKFFTTLISATNQAWGMDTINWWRLPFKSLILLGIMVCAVLISLAIPMLETLLKNSYLPVNSLSVWFHAWVSLIIPALIVFVGLNLFYKLAPNRLTRFSEVWLAAFSVTLLLQAAQSLFLVYLENFAAFNVVYGAFGGIMALLLWIYLSGFIVIFGACLCAAQAEAVCLNKPRLIGE